MPFFLENLIKHEHLRCISSEGGYNSRGVLIQESKIMHYSGDILYMVSWSWIRASKGDSIRGAYWSRNRKSCTISSCTVMSAVEFGDSWILFPSVILQGNMKESFRRHQLDARNLLICSSFCDLTGNLNADYNDIPIVLLHLRSLMVPYYRASLGPRLNSQASKFIF